MIELYIENRKIDITDDLEINFNYETIDTERLSSIKNNFSKTVNVPGTPRNNITFGHLFRYDKHIPTSGPSNIESNFDPHKKVNWFINKNGALINRGYCTLDNILVKNERDITYQLTLYGGIGEFFYSLKYNEDSSIKTLADLYWNWYTKNGLIGHGPQTTESDENTRTLYKCSAEIVASSYHSLNPLYTYEGTTDIEKDIVFVPCYTGLYEDFDSRHMIVSTFNQHYNPGIGNEIMTENTKERLLNAFPDTYVEGDETYTTIGKNFSSTDPYKYGLVTFSRDLDPWEAGDLRINELPVAVRLSKLMNVISQPINNGGYEVIWDNDITNSFHWQYGWVLLGKILQEREKLELLTFIKDDTHDEEYSTLDVNWNGWDGTPIMDDAESYELLSNMSTIGVVPKGNYNLSINLKPRLSLNSRYSLTDNYPNLVSGTWNSGTIWSDKPNKRHFLWTTSVLIHRIYDGDTLLKTIADVFYYTEDTINNYFGSNDLGINVNDIKQILYGKINQRFMPQGQFIDNYYFHDARISGVESTQFNFNYKNEVYCDNETIMTSFSLESDSTNLRVEREQGLMWTRIGGGIQFVDCGRYGVDDIRFVYETSTTVSSNIAPFGEGSTTDSFYMNSSWIWPSPSSANQKNSFGFILNESLQNGIMLSKNTGFNILELDKKTLFANSETPFRYLSDYCKMMNYRFICDNTAKKITIKTLKNYYLDNEIIDLENRVDIGRDINIKYISTKNKTINVGLDTPETYPTYLYDKKSKTKFNTKRFDTKIEFNINEDNLLKDLSYKNIIDWQQSSIYYNLYPQFPRAYDVQSISWTLFNKDSANAENIKKKELFTVGTPSNQQSLSSANDFLPKLSLFDKDNRYVDFESSLLFLNGFVKNYDYTFVNNKYVLSPRVNFSNDTYEQFLLNQGRCYVYDFKYIDYFTSWGCYSTDQKGTATSWVLPMFSRDLYNVYVPDVQVWNSAQYKLASWNLSDQEGLDNQYDLSNTVFVYDPNYNYRKTIPSDTHLTNEYNINGIPQDDEDYTERIYDRNWKDYLEDLYDRNTRDVTAYVDLSGLGDANTIMRKIYSYKSHLWIMTKLENFKISETVHDKFTKVKMHKIKELDTWTN